MKIKLQVNGESMTGQNIEDLEKYGMNDSEYEIDMEIGKIGLETLEDLLDRMVEESQKSGAETFFNWHIIIKE
jgi:hypothetical protein